MNQVLANFIMIVIGMKEALIGNFRIKIFRKK
jgi:hypothetical protein